MTPTTLDDTTIDKQVAKYPDTSSSVHSDVHQSSETKTSGSSFWRPPIIWGLLIVGSACGFFAGRLWVVGEQKSESQLKLSPLSSNAKESEPERVVVTASPVTRRDVERSIQAVGTLNGFEELTVSSKLEGTVVRIFHDLSSTVKPGDVLLELDTTDAALSVRQSEMSLQAELAKWGFGTVPEQDVDITQLPNVVTAKLRWELAKSRLERMLPLQSTNSVTADDLEQSKSEAKVAESEFQNQLLLARSSVATVRLKAAEWDIAKKRLADCQIKVPTPSNILREEDGFYTVSERLVSEGTLLRPGTEVFRLVLGKSMKLKLSIPQIYADQVNVGQSVAIDVDGEDRNIVGMIKRVSPAIDRSTRTFTVEVDVPNADGRLKAGSFAKASISIGKSTDSICVPLASVSSFAGIQKIFLIENDLAKEVKVTLGEQADDWVEILTPKINKDARVITSGQRMLSNDIPVRERLSESQNGANGIDAKRVEQGIQR